ncbi:MAG: response regulator, partial [Proteobacteria bacterium]
PTGEQIGTLCVIDNKKNQLNKEQRLLLESLAEQVVALLELRRNVKIANEASRAKSEFLSNVSHEIRTPLGAILGFTEALSRQELDLDERRKYLEIIERNGRSLAKLVDDILDLAKVEAQQMLLDIQENKIHPLVEEVCENFYEAVRNKGITLDFEVSSKTPKVIRFDEKRVRQILTNIIGNAVKFTSAGSVVLRVDYDIRQLVFTISDTGIGMSEEQRGDLFKAFKQGDKSVTRKFGGTGLGLHLTKRLCELQGGGLELASSQLGAGSTFVATILAEAGREEQAKPDPGSAPQIFDYETLDLSSKRILLVDDSPDNLLLLKVLFKKTKAGIVTALDGSQGMTKALESSFDAIFMDIQMPVMDGHTATKLLREKGYVQPIIAVTAHAMKEEKARAVDSGFSHYLSKPIDRGEFSNILMKIFKPKSVAN